MDTRDCEIELLFHCSKHGAAILETGTTKILIANAEANKIFETISIPVEAEASLQ